MATVQRGDLFSQQLVDDLINKVKGHSSLAILSQREPVSFNGNDIFTFTLDNEVDIVAESGAKSEGGATVGKTKMVPIKVEYSARFSDEFIYASEEEQIRVLQDFNDGYAKKLARGIDLMAMHGVNPRTGLASEVIGTNYLDGLVTQTVDYNEATADDSLEDAIFLVQGAQNQVTGLALSPSAGRDMSKIEVNGVRQYPEFRFGGNPGNLSGMGVDVNETVSAFGETQMYVGDFANLFKWGYAKEIPLQVHTAGDPDNTGRDLAGHNEILLRSETYIGWGIIDPNAFARVVKATVEG